MTEFLYGFATGCLCTAVAAGILAAWWGGQQAARHTAAEDAIDSAADTAKAKEKASLVEALKQNANASPEELRDALNHDDSGGPPTG